MAPHAGRGALYCYKTAAENGRSGIVAVSALRFSSALLVVRISSAVTTFENNS